MSGLSFLHTPLVCFEFGWDTLRLAKADGVLAWPLDRDASGKLTAACRQKLIAELAKAVDRKQWQLKTRAICALNAAGILLRRVTLPSLASSALQSVLRLQIEKDFPLPPERLAWGWQQLPGIGEKRELLIAAVRREVVEDYSTLLNAAGFAPEFTIAAWARHFLCPAITEPYAFLEANSGPPELISFENGIPSSLRIFPGQTLTADTLCKSTPAKMIYLSGASPALPALAAALSPRMDCRRLEPSAVPGETAALAGLKKAAAGNQPLLTLQLQSKVARVPWKEALVQHRQPLTRLALLLLALLIFPYAEPLLLKPLVAHKLAAFKKQKQQFDSVVAPELNFLLYLKQNQPPYLDALYEIARVSAPGAHINSMTLDQQGDLSLKLELPNAQQMMDFRQKLIDSRYFSLITVDEQSPVQNQPKINVRLSLRWKPPGQRPVVKIESPPLAADVAPPAGGPPHK